MRENGRELMEGYEVIADGMTYAQGAAFDKEGNLYWCDKTEKRIYKYNRGNGVTLPFLDIHFMPSALAVDTAGHLLVAADYSELKRPNRDSCSRFMTPRFPSVFLLVL